MLRVNKKSGFPIFFIFILCDFVIFVGDFCWLPVYTK